VRILGAVANHPTTTLKEYAAQSVRPPFVQKLGAVESANLLGCAATLAHAEAVFESDTEIVKWLRSSQPTLEGRRPIDLLGNPNSRQAIDDVLTRIEHGVFA
jgi:putative toxin-antitoxin system antitoxin component (TIGR02293 family)